MAKFKAGDVLKINMYHQYFGDDGYLEYRIKICNVGCENNYGFIYYYYDAVVIARKEKTDFGMVGYKFIKRNNIEVDRTFDLDHNEDENEEEIL